MIHHIEELQQEVADLKDSIEILLESLETAFPSFNVRQQIDLHLLDREKKRNDKRWATIDHIWPQVPNKMSAGGLVDLRTTRWLLEPIVDIAIQQYNKDPELFRNRFAKSYDTDNGLVINMNKYGCGSSNDNKASSTAMYEYTNDLYLIAPINRSLDPDTDEKISRNTEIPLSLSRELYDVNTGLTLYATHDLTTAYFYASPLLLWCSLHCNNRIDPLSYTVLMDNFGPHANPAWFQEQITAIDEYYCDDVIVDFSLKFGRGDQWTLSDYGPVDLNLARADGHDKIILRVAAAETIDNNAISIDLLNIDVKQWEATWNQMTVLARMAMMSILKYAMNENFGPLFEDDGREDQTEYIRVSEYSYVIRERFSRSLSERLTADAENPNSEEEDTDD